MNRRMVVGVKIIGWYVIVVSVLSLGNSLMSGEEIYADNRWAEVFSAVSPLISLVSVFLGINLLRMRNWARKWLIGWLGVGVVFVFLTPVILTEELTDNPLILAFHVIAGAVIPISIIFYLSRNKIKGSFEERHLTTAS